MSRAVRLLSLVLAGSAASAATPEELALMPYAPPRAPDRGAWPRERLLQFMRELTDFVIRNHTVTDPHRKTFGMVYEFWKDGRQIQEFGLDSMHDGAWFMSALIVANRADPAGDWLAKAQMYPVAFYTNLLLHSDRLFPKMEPTSEDLTAWTMPTKGWIPRGWDDGGGFDRKTGKHFADSYFTSSNHLAQDVADSLMNVWLTTRDPRVAAALQELNAAKTASFGSIQGLEIAAAVSSSRADAFLRYKLPEFTPEAMNPYFTGLYQQKGHHLPTYDDGLAWMYRQATAVAQVAGEFPQSFAAHALARCYGYTAAVEQFFDDRPYEYGLYFFDLQRPPAFIEGKGRLESYSSASRNFYGARGTEISWVAAALLPELKAHPDLWNAMVPAKFAAEPRVPIVDEPPATDGQKDDGYVKVNATNGDEISLLSDPRNLHIFVQSARPEIALTFKHAGPVTGEVRVGKIVVKKDGTVTAANDKGERLTFASAFSAGERWSVEIRIPYSVVPAQSQWINGVDHGRYEIACIGGKPQTVYFLSSAARIQQRLENLALGTVDYWHDVWTKTGMIPSGISAPTARAGAWEISDAGNCAHLIHTIAFWLIATAGEREWEIVRRDFPDQPKPAPPLPASVISAQRAE